MANSRKSRSLNSKDKVQLAVERAIREFLTRVCVSGAGDTPSIAVAYSGGLDSIVLLHFASRYARSHDVPIHAFHIHHGLSPNADAWLEHCRNQAVKLGIAFEAATVIVEDSEKRGLEEAARIARYRALGELCRRNGVLLLLMAHHRDDQAETVLLQLLRGAGLPGMSGMSAFQSQHDLLGPGIALGRPLLDMARSDLEKSAVDLGLGHIHDESNRDTTYRRNAIRHDIAPVIENHFPGFATMVSRTALHVQSAQSLLAELAMIDYAACKYDDGKGMLNLTKMRTLSAKRFENLLRYWLGESGVQVPSTARLAEICFQLLAAAHDRHPVFDFGTMRLHRIGDRLELHPIRGAPPSDPVLLEWNGEPSLSIPQWRGRLIFDKVEGLGIDPKLLNDGPLRLCPRAGRERIKLAANRPSRSLKNLFQETMTASWQREWLPLLYIRDELVFAAGLGMDCRYAHHGKGVMLRWEGA
jgi:tRNA(Ile)-lysidine synthase